MPRGYYEEVLNVDFPKVPELPTLSLESQLFAASVALCGVLALLSRRLGAGEQQPSAQPATRPNPVGSEESATFTQLKWRYLAVYLPGVFGDWIQGAYLYALYRAYDLDMAEIGYLFMIGYCTSAVLGTYIASLGDRYGHRLCVIAYGVLYSASCVTMHSANFWVLLLGRVLGGVAYSLLYSSFEAWAVAEATKCGQRGALPQLFATGTFANAMAAVVAGMVGHAIVEMEDALKASGAAPATTNSFTLPFDAAMPALLVCALGARLLWREYRGGVYHGDATGGVALGSIRQAFNEICSVPGLRLVMTMIAFYESALYVFVFLWTPVLEARASLESPVHSTIIPHGVIFSLFMCCKMAGSQVFVLLLGDRMHAANILSATFCMSIVCFMVPLVTSSYVATLLAFCLYEFGLGLYWPAVAILRADLVPDDIRSSVASLFRVPLNILVVMCLFLIGKTPESVVLCWCCAQLGLCLWSSLKLPAPGRSIKADAARALVLESPPLSPLTGAPTSVQLQHSPRSQRPPSSPRKKLAGFL